MENSAEPHLRDEFDSLMSWWRDAGVDTVIDESPRNWLVADDLPPSTDRKGERASPSRSAAPVAKPLAVAPPGIPTDLPDSLDAFVAWLQSDIEFLGNYPKGRRLVAEGAGPAELMIVTDVPERDDIEQGRLLTGEAGALFDKMLSAMGIERDLVYLATLAPGRPPSGMLTDIEADRLAPLLRRHIGLAAPKRLWLMGRAASRAVLGTDEAKAGGKLHTVNEGGVMITAIATLHPRVLLKEPKSKARVWADMQRLMAAGV